MRINKKRNQKAVNHFLNNKYITDYNIKESINWIDITDHSKGQEESYVCGTIQTEINNKNDLDKFMKIFLQSPLRLINIKISHNIKQSYTSTMHSKNGKRNSYIIKLNTCEILYNRS